MTTKVFVVIVALIWLTTLLFKKTFYPSKIDIHEFIKKQILSLPQFSKKVISSLNFVAGVNYTTDEYNRIRNLVIEGNFEDLAQETYSLETDSVFVYSLIFEPNEYYTLLVLNKSNKKPEINEIFRMI